MKKVLVVGMVLALGGCAGVETANNVLAKLAGNSIPEACKIIAVAEGYFHQLESRISPENVAIGRKAEAGVKVICDNPPKNVAEAFGSLVSLWFAIQNATKAN